MINKVCFMKTNNRSSIADVLFKIVLLSFLSFYTGGIVAQNKQVGFWISDCENLPAFEFTGDLPFLANMKNGEPAKLPTDPWFILGNYRMTVFPHVSGNYQLITGERAWARLNQGDKPNSGTNSATIILNGKSHQLVGENSLACKALKCKRIFGSGFASYKYSLPEGIICERTIAVKPSENPNEGVPALLLTVKFRNNSKRKSVFEYKEGIAYNFVSTRFQRTPLSNRPVKYIPKVSLDSINNSSFAKFEVMTDENFLSYTQSGISWVDLVPPTLFMKALTTGTQTSADSVELFTSGLISLKPKEEKIIQMLVGFLYSSDNLDNISIEMSTNTNGVFQKEWKKRLPAFPDEKDVDLKREMIWNAYCLEAMATYNEYYKETQVPQGTTYDYDHGQHASARDQLQHGLPLCYYNPALAKSNLKYMMKRMTALGEVKLIEVGYGVATNAFYNTSDQQLFFIQMINEYLRVTGDYGFLNEKIQYYPLGYGGEGTTLNFIENAYLFLRDDIRVGAHGLIRLKISDWNDAFYQKGDVPYMTMINGSVSHLNSAMAIVVLENLVKMLDKASSIFPDLKIDDLKSSISNFRRAQLKSFLKDLGNRTFSKRAYIGKNAVGESDMWLEPQGFMLQIPEISIEKRKKLFDEINERLMKNEIMGARQMETPLKDVAIASGSRENGGFWYALNGPVILGVSLFDKLEAQKLLKKMTFNNLSRTHPDYWTSYWTAADNIDSSLLPSEGLTDQKKHYWEFPAFCAHAHAWPLYCYFKLKESCN